LQLKLAACVQALRCTDGHRARRQFRRYPVNEVAHNRGNALDGSQGVQGSHCVQSAQSMTGKSSPAQAMMESRAFIRPERFPSILHSHIPAQLLFYAIGFSASMGLAVLSWHLWEKHFLRLKALFPYGRVPGDRSAK